MEAFQHILTQILTVAPRLSGSEARLLTHLTYLGLIEASTEVQVSERALMAGTNLGHGVLQRAKGKLHEKGLVRYCHGTVASRDRYHLTYLNGVQLPLFTKQGAPETGAGVRPNQAQGAPETGAGVRPNQAQGAPETGADNGEKVGGVRPKQAHVVDFPQQDIDLPHARVDSNRGSFVGSSFSSIDRVLTTTTIEEHNQPAAARLGSYLTSFAAKHGSPSIAGKVPDDTILAQCLAVRPSIELIERLVSLAVNLKGKQIQTWGWFVTAFLCEFEGVSPKLVQERRHILRQRKPVSKVTADENFAAGLISEATKGVGTLR